MSHALTTLQLVKLAAQETSTYPPDEIAFLKQKVADMEAQQTQEIADWKYQRALDRKRIAALELYITTKKDGRRDFFQLAIDLVKELARSKQAMDYRDVKHFSHLHLDQEAYRLMELTVKKFPVDCKLLHTSNKKRNTVIVYTP